MNLKDFGSKSTPNGLNWIANIGKGCQCLTEIGLSLDKLHWIANIGKGCQCLTEIGLSLDKLYYLGIVNFKHKYV